MAKEKMTSVAIYNRGEFDQFTENITRVRYVKYFKGTKPAFKEKESTGILAGAFLSLTVGCFMAPYLLKIGSHFPASTIKGFALVMAVTTVVLAFFGFRKMIEESKHVYKPVPDEEFDRYLAFDLKGLATRAQFIVKEATDDLLQGRDSIEGIEPILLYSTEEYSSNVNLPLMIKKGDDGLIRSSNLYVMLIFPTEKALYINITYLNLLTGAAKFDKVYACPYENIESITYEDRKYNLISQAGRDEIKNVKSFMIRAKTGNKREVGVDIVDYDIIKQYGGHFDETAALNALETLNNRMK